MDVRIIEKEAFKVVGKSITTTTENGQNYRDIANFWKESIQNGFNEQLGKKSGPLGVLGICFDYVEGQDEFKYLIGAEKLSENVLQDWEEVEIPTHTWAVFPVHGAMPEAMQKAFGEIYSNWLPSSGYKHAGGPEMEVYLSDGDSSSEDYYSEIWITVEKK